MIVKKYKITERLLCEVWRKGLLNSNGIFTDFGQKINVINPGWKNKDRGPDFLRAVICIDDSYILIGDIEVHVNGQDWKAHGHQNDCRYNSVILHVVWTGTKGVKLQNGRVVPTISLKSLFNESVDRVGCFSENPNTFLEACYNAQQRIGDDEIGRLTDAMGKERFHVKASHFSDYIKAGSGSQSLYTGIMEALGYSKNKNQFQALAEKVPLDYIETMISGHNKEEQIRLLERNLLYRAGLCERDGGELAEFPENNLLNNERMLYSSWHLFRVRPENHPVRRIAGMVQLLVRALVSGGLVNFVVALVHNSDESAKWIEDSLIVKVHVDRNNRRYTLIGRRRAREIVINNVLPFVYAWAISKSDRRLALKALRLYSNCRQSGEYGITQERERVLMPYKRGIINSAQRQQGLLHLTKTFCFNHRCIDCPIYKRINISTSYVIESRRITQEYLGEPLLLYA